MAAASSPSARPGSAWWRWAMPTATRTVPTAPWWRWTRPRHPPHRPVSMDVALIDLTDLPDTGLGSRVELWGEQVPVNHIAQAAGTIAYELLCNVKRVRLEIEYARLNSATPGLARKAVHRDPEAPALLSAQFGFDDHASHLRPARSIVTVTPLGVRRHQMAPWSRARWRRRL